MSALHVQLLLTGNELMSGDIVDSNSAMIAQQLKELGIEIKRKVTVSDDLSLLIEEIQYISQQADVLIINGGLGPTVDDLTAQALALAVKQPLKQHPDAHQHLIQWCQNRKTPLTEQNLKQAMLPKEAKIVANRIGSAVGFEVVLNNCQIICTPGVPPELRVMLDEQIVPTISKKVPEHIKTHVTRLQVFGFGESGLQKVIDEQLNDWPQEVELGFRAASAVLEVKLTTRTIEAQQLKVKWLPNLLKLLGDHVFNIISDKPMTLAESVVNLLQKAQLKLTLAESCTGGLIASHITKVSGASQVFEAGFVTYSNEIKNKILAVSQQTLSGYGAVSEQTIKAMAYGALEKSSADYTIAVSGIAGPNGGTEEKPVGVVWLAWGNKDNLHTACLLIPGNRAFFQHTVANIGLDLMRRLLIGSNEVPRYIRERQFPKRPPVNELKTRVNQGNN